MMNLNCALLLILVMIQLVSVYTGRYSSFKVVGIADDVVDTVLNLSDLLQSWVVEIQNESTRPAQLFCASGDDKIGGPDGIHVRSGQKLKWSFHRHPTTQFWCQMVWHNKRVKWDVFLTKWNDAPNPTIWLIRDNGVFDKWQMRKWLDLNI